METDSIQLKTLISTMALILLSEVVGSLLPVPNQLTVICITRLLEITCILTAIFILEKNLTCIGIHRNGNVIAIRRGVFWCVGFGILAAAGAFVLTVFGLQPLQLIRVELPKDLSSLMLFFLVGGIVGPVAEEIFFRGIIFRFFRRWGFGFSLVFSTIVFAAMHPGASGIPVPQIVGGILFASAFEFEKNLLVPVMLHVLGNLAIFALPLFTS